MRRSDAIRHRGEGEPTIDPAALATLGIDYDAVIGRLEQTFGAGARERTHAACLTVCPRAKVALAFAVDYAGGGTVHHDHLLLGMLRVPDCVASPVLTQHGATLEGAEACWEWDQQCPTARAASRRGLRSRTGRLS